MRAKSDTEERGSTASVRNVVVYSFAILAMPIIGEQIGELLQIWRVLELIEAIPAIVCAFFVSRMPRLVKAAMHIGVKSSSSLSRVVFTGATIQISVLANQPQNLIFSPRIAGCAALP